MPAKVMFLLKGNAERGILMTRKKRLPGQESLFCT
jgi:hypothetical protein